MNQSGDGLDKQDSLQPHDPGNRTASGDTRRTWQKPVLLELSVNETEGNFNTFTNETDFKNLTS